MHVHKYVRIIHGYIRDALQYQIVCFFNIVQTAFDPPPLVFEHLCCGLYCGL